MLAAEAELAAQVDSRAEIAGLAAVAATVVADKPEARPAAPGGDAAARIHKKTGTHGQFPDVARIAQNLKRTFHQERGWDRLGSGQREAVESIAVKLAHIVAGDPSWHDHWVQLEAFAQLGGRNT